MLNGQGVVAEVFKNVGSDELQNVSVIGERRASTTKLNPEYREEGLAKGYTERR